MANEFRAKLDEERRKAAQPAPAQRLAPRTDDGSQASAPTSASASASAGAVIAGPALDDFTSTPVKDSSATPSTETTREQVRYANTNTLLRVA